jgi:queuine tRNA-ribosyltransferase
MNNFRIFKEDTRTRARLGEFRSRRGSFTTPSFFPVATQGAVKGLSPRQLEEIGIEGLLTNAYHLYLRPGTDVIAGCGGLHKFMNFDRTIITDSGGYQIFSLPSLRRLDAEGVEFQSHIDGRRLFLTPEDVMRIQLDLGSDIVVPLDECVRSGVSYEQARTAAERTLAWARRSKDFFSKAGAQGVSFWGISQGSTYPDLRKRCLDELMALDIDGLCIGGLSVGEPEDLRYNILSFIQANADRCYLRYFMGHGKPREIIEAVSLGVDLFDCIVPTRYGRTGTAFTERGELMVRDAPCTRDGRPLDEACSCYTCRNFSRAYLRHLINAREMLGVELITYHNVFWYKNFMDRIRQAIKEDRFLEFKKDFLQRYEVEICRK